MRGEEQLFPKKLGFLGRQQPRGKKGKKFNFF
jgi:hypothetical protein